MACVYYLNGKLFNSEIELDSFLLERGEAYSKYGDIVFSMATGHLVASYDKAVLVLILGEKVKEWKGRRIWSDDRKSYEYKYPYIGVNRFLASYKVTDEAGNSKLLFPTFNPAEYWGRRYNKWRGGEYNEEELLILFGGRAPYAVTDRTTLEAFRDKIENKWKELCLAGDAIHAVFELYLLRSADTTGKEDYNRNRLKNDPSYKEEFKKILNAKTFEKELSKVKKVLVNFSDLIDDAKLDNIIDRIEKIATELDKRYTSDDGTPPIYFPEFKVSSKLDNPIDGADTILGIIDLLVIDGNGTPHVIDYKTSPKYSRDFTSAKRLTYTYLVGTYGRLLNLNGFNINETDYLITPIRIENFREGENGKYSFTGIEIEPDIFEDVGTTIRTHDKIRNNLEDLFELLYEPSISSDKMYQDIAKLDTTCFPTYDQKRIYTDEEIDLMIKDSEYKYDVDEDGNYKFKPKGSRSDFIITVNATKGKDAFFKAVKTYTNKLVKFRDLATVSVRKGLKKALELGSTHGIDFVSFTKDSDIGVSSTWFMDVMERYCNGQWKLKEEGTFDELAELGILTLYNKESCQYDFIRISNANLFYQHKFGNNLNIAGAVNSDLYYESKKDTLIVPAVTGNIELMETMAALNSLTLNDNFIIGNVLVYDPVHGFGIGMSNAELEYNFNELITANKLDIVNNFRNNKIQLATKVHLACLLFRDILIVGKANLWKGDYGQFKDEKTLSCMSQLETAIEDDVEEKLKALEEIRKMLEKGDKGGQLKDIIKDQSELSKAHILLYNLILIAIAELKNINFRQLLSDHSKYLDTRRIFDKGWSGSYIDNPGNLSSETLNLLTTLTTQAYLQVRIGMLKKLEDIRKIIGDLKKEKQSKGVHDLYSNLYNIEDGDIKFKNPFSDGSLSSTEKLVIVKALDIINANRFPGDDWKDSMATKYLRVPLKMGNSKAFTTPENLLDTFKSRISKYNPKTWFKNIKDTAGNYLNEVEQDSGSVKESLLFIMKNIFDTGEGGGRLDYIARKGVKSFESDLESILLSHHFAYLEKEAIDDVMPLLKASMIHLSLLGFNQNKEFKNDLEYAENYIRNKIKGEDIVDPVNKPIYKKLAKIRKAASFLTLAFSPVLFTYLVIQGFWTDIRLYFLSIYSDSPFTFTNLKKAMVDVYKEMFDYSGKPTLNSKINELYGINDMDINTYAERLKTSEWNFERFAFHFTSRPDYYNRMTLFRAKMEADGCIEAHSIDENGNLIYDYKKDQRYAAYANNDTSDIEAYNKAKSNYIAAAKLFILENATNENGTMFKMGDALPRAYTTLESESMKDVGDTIYGYYSTEKKSLIHSILLGSMWMLFRTFWSGKKNLYLAKGGVKLQGLWKEVTEVVDGVTKTYVYLKDSSGKVLFNLPPILKDKVEASDVVVTRWEGDWKEGIIKSLADTFGMAYREKKSIGAAIKEKWYDPDINVRNAYRQNIILLGYDLALFAAIGPIISASLLGDLDKMKKEADKSDIAESFKIAAALIACRSVANSFLDFNFINSIGDPLVSWNPFSLSYLASMIKNTWGVVTLDKNIFDALGNTSGVGRTFLPVFKALKYSTL